MSTTRTRSRSPGAARARGPAFPVVEAKLSIPPTRAGVIPRDQLLRRLRAEGRPIVAVVAPPGYGKTTLLAQWAETSGRPVVWLTVDNRDNDPAVLLTYLAVGLDRVRPIDRTTFATLASPAAMLMAGAVPRLVAEMQGSDPRPLVILDDVHLLTETASMDVLTELAAALPPGSQLAIGGRSDIALPLPLLRGSGRLLEIGTEDLILSADETASLLRATGMELPADAAADILARTEGWPVAAYLAALSFGSGRDRDPLGSFSGADRFVSDYVWSQILDRVPPKDLRFLTRTSVLDRMSGPLCDAVTATKGSADTLRRLETASLLLVPLDRTREWYRYHYLLRDVLRAELERREPDLVPELQHRAAEWHERQEMFDAAVEYHIGANDTERAAKLITMVAQPMYRVGRVSTLQRWLAWLEERGTVADQAPLAVLAGWLHAMIGDAAGADRWAAVAEHSSFVGPLPDGSPAIEPWIASLRALRCAEGAATMRSDAERALEETPPTSFFHVIALTLMGVGMTLNGQPGGETLYADGADAGEATEAYPLACLSLGLLAASMTARGDWAAAASTLARAPRMIDEAGLEEYWTSAIIYAVRARLALHRGDREAAQADLVRAQRLRPVLTHAIPWAAVQARLEMLRAHIALPDPAGARTLLREIDGIIERSPDLGTLKDDVEEVRHLVQAMPRGTTGASALTAAELRLVPYLHTYMSFRDIAQRLYVSPNTVKTQAVSLYRKLGVSSRSEAMERAEELGLIDR
ncbi:MAG TPA: AAA family ATPase [Actinomycetota bacterium]|nr:AAA family ATPase [Actinomycetota bacterium]